jgi:archaellin
MEKTMDLMNDQAKLGIFAGILLIGFILIGAVSASVIMTGSKNISEKDLNKITNEVVDEICSYLQIKHIVGKYQTIQGEEKIQKIAILIKPLVSQDIDISRMTIELSNGEQLQMLFYNGCAESLNSHSLFEHPLWDSVTPGTFSLLTTIDEDNSIITSHVINKNTDMMFILLKLPDDIAMKYGDELRVTILPSPGMGRTVSLESPLTTKHVVTLYE